MELSGYRSRRHGISRAGEGSWMMGLAKLPSASSGLNVTYPQVQLAADPRGQRLL